MELILILMLLLIICYQHFLENEWRDMKIYTFGYWIDEPYEENLNAVLRDMQKDWFIAAYRTHKVEDRIVVTLDCMARRPYDAIRRTAKEILEGVE